MKMWYMPLLKTKVNAISILDSEWCKLEMYDPESCVIGAQRQTMTSTNWPVYLRGSTVRLICNYGCIFCEYNNLRYKYCKLSIDIVKYSVYI